MEQAVEEHDVTAKECTAHDARKVDHKPNLSWEPTGGWETAFKKILSMLTSQSDLSVNGPLTSQGQLQASEKLDTEQVTQRIKQGHYSRHPEAFHVDALLVFRAQLQGTSLQPPQKHEFCAAGSRAEDNLEFERKCAEIWDKIRAAAGSGITHTHTEDSQKELIEIYRGKVGVVSQYLDKLDEEVGHYVDSASGKTLRVEDESIPLKAFSSESIIAQCESDPMALDEDMICPITKQLMLDPVKCIFGDDDSFTRAHERRAIERHFQVQLSEQVQNLEHVNTIMTLKCPDTRRPLKTTSQAGKCKLVMLPDEKMLKLINDLRSAKEQKEAPRKQEIEGREEHLMILRRLGYDDSALDSAQDMGSVTPIESPQALLKRLQEGNTMCVMGPPTSGKTLCMAQVACAAAQAREKIRRG
jgi:hypothetical protein